jgi:hypothetical protein
VKNNKIEEQTYTTGDVVGCLMDWERGKVFFTRNGILLREGVEIHDRVEWFPAVGSMVMVIYVFIYVFMYLLQERGDILSVNFGSEPFVFDIAMMNQVTELEEA